MSLISALFIEQCTRKGLKIGAKKFSNMFQNFKESKLERQKIREFQGNITEILNSLEPKQCFQFEEVLNDLFIKLSNSYGKNGDDDDVFNFSTEDNIELSGLGSAEQFELAWKFVKQNWKIYQVKLGNLVKGLFDNGYLV